MLKLPPSLSVRVSGLFAVHFFGYGLFLPFFPVVLEHEGFTAADIGFVLGAGTIARIASSPILSNLADRTGQRRKSILIYSLLGTAFIGLFVFGNGLYVLGAAVIGYMVFKAPVLPLSDAYALDAAHNTGADYARMRLWGSAGFVVASMVGGVLATDETVSMILFLIGFASLLTGLVVMFLPPQTGAAEEEHGGEAVVEAPFRTVWFWPVLTLLGLFQASHAAFYGFGTLYWQAAGIADQTIGFLWAVGVVAEIALFTVAGRIAQRLDPPIFLIVAGVAAVVRWGLFPFADTIASMVALQLLHALTFGAAHLGAIAILARVVPSRWAGTGQGLLATSIGIQMAIGLGVCGALFETNPDLPFYVMAAASAVGTVVMLALTPLVRQRMSAVGV